MGKNTPPEMSFPLGSPKASSSIRTFEQSPLTLQQRTAARQVLHEPVTRTLPFCGLPRPSHTRLWREREGCLNRTHLCFPLLFFVSVCVGNPNYNEMF